MNHRNSFARLNHGFGHARLGAFTVGISWLAAGLTPATAQSPAATIQVNLAQRKAPVPATLYGISMEEISHAFDGGIYAELIQNRSFEEGVPPPGMQLLSRHARPHCATGPAA